MLAYFLPEAPSEVLQIFDEVVASFFFLIMGGGEYGKQKKYTCSQKLAGVANVGNNIS